MASPMVEGRVDPHKKAHFSLHISERIASGEDEGGSYSSVKYNHKPAQPTASRTSKLTATSTDNYRLTLEDRKEGNKKDVFVFTGKKSAPKKSYILLFDPASQKATLEPLSSAYTFNLASRNGTDVSASHSKIYPRKEKGDGEDPADTDDLFDESARDDVNAEPDADNPYDFRHFLSSQKRGDESEYNIASSPDYRTGTGSAANTPQLPARKPAATVTSKPKPTTQPAPKLKKRKSPEPESRKPTTKKPAAPTVRLERRATENKPVAKPARKPAAPPPSSKIKSAEIIHSSDESDADADGEPDDIPEPSREPIHRSPSPVYHAPSSPESDEDEEMEDVDAGAGATSGFEIEVPDAPRASKPRHNALASLGLGQNLGLGYLKSPSNGPISLASVANSAEGSPNPHFTPRKHQDVEEIDFGDMGGGRADDSEEEEEGGFEHVEDRDVDVIDIGPPAQTQERKGSVDGGGGAVEDAEGEEEDPLYKEMMMGLAGGDSSEESEEE